MNPNFGFELTVMEIIFFRYGRENEINLSDVKYTTPQFPVSRFGFGINVPIHKISKFKAETNILFDYGYSQWYHEEEFKNVEDRLNSSYCLQIRLKL